MGSPNLSLNSILMPMVLLQQIVSLSESDMISLIHSHEDNLFIYIEAHSETQYYKSFLDWLQPMEKNHKIKDNTGFVITDWVLPFYQGHKWGLLVGQLYSTMR